jgi:hypothetical protein
VIPAHSRATAVGLMTMIGFGGAGLMPIVVAQASESIGMAAALTSMSILYVAAAILLFATRTPARRAVLETRAGETELHNEARP